MAVIRETIAETRAIRFEGNNYSAEWRQEAEKRGLPHARNTAAALHVWDDAAAKLVFTRKGILKPEELEARIAPAAEPRIIDVFYDSPDGTRELGFRAELPTCTDPAWLRRMRERRVSGGHLQP